MAPDEYLLIEDRRDPDAPRRWEIAGEIREKPISIREKVAELMRCSVGRRLTAEELRHVAGNSGRWTLAVRELKAGDWPLAARMLGDDGLPTGIYVLSAEPRT
jgi:hypothetical protein